MRIWANVWGGLLAASVFCMAAAAERPAPTLTPSEQLELQTLRTQLADPARDMKTKREAAMLLLTRTYPQAAAALADFLADGSNRPAQTAIAEAIAQSGRTHPSFVKPLLGMLTGSEPSARSPAASALSAYKDDGVLEEFVKLATDREGDRATRLVVISAMQRIVDKRSAAVLIGLLDDPEEAVRSAACDALARLTNFRAFGRDTARWKRWWTDGEKLPRSEWLAALADSLARANQALEGEVAELRARLGTALNDLYTATPPAGRDALLESMLKDALADVRLAGTKLARQRLTAAAVPDSLRAAVRARVTDPSPAVRREAALLVTLNNPAADQETLELLAGRLKTEQAAEVRVALYQAFGLLRDPGAFDLLVAGVGGGSGPEAVAAAASLGRVAAGNPLSEHRRAAAVAALSARFNATAKGDSDGLREALLEAMGTLKDKRLAALMTAALKDPAAPVRLSALKGLVGLASPDSAAAIAPLVADSDPGVRLAAIAAIGTLGGQENLDAILRQTDPAEEPDAAVRQQAWTVVTSLLAKADVPRIAALAESLEKRKGNLEHYIDVLKLWAGKVAAGKVAEWAPVRLKLGEALLSADRPAEAARQLQTVHAAMLAAADERAPEVWLKMIEAMLATDDAAVAARIAEAADAQQLAKALAALTRRLAALQAGKDWDNLARLAQAALERLNDRLTVPQRSAMRKSLEEARSQRQIADRQHVGELVARLAGTDPDAKAAAARELTSMKTRAVRPLLEELQNALRAERPSAATEKAILELLAGLAPRLTGYDPAAAPAERLKTVEAWMKQWGS